MIPHALADAAADALSKVPGWAWAAVALFGAWCGRAYSTYQERAALRREVEAVCETCKRPERSCKCPDKEHGNGAARSLRLDVQETLAGVKAIAAEQQGMRTEIRDLRSDTRGLRVDVDSIMRGEVTHAARKVAMQLGREDDPLAHLVDQERQRKERA